LNFCSLGKKQSDYRNLWVSGLSSVTRATDLKHLFSKLGKVVAAKVVTNAKTPGARCYGFVTMATSEDATKCIKGLNLTELHGRFISVEAVSIFGQLNILNKLNNNILFGYITAVLKF
ncbi:hypothetical protein AAG570_002785, partial [Ranatra chinensis]